MDCEIGSRMAEKARDEHSAHDFYVRCRICAANAEGPVISLCIRVSKLVLLGVSENRSTVPVDTMSILWLQFHRVGTRLDTEQGTLLRCLLVCWILLGM